MMFRVVLAAGIVCLTASASLAQAELVKERNDIMDGFGRPFYVALNRMQRGQAPYDQKQVDEGFAYVVQNAPKLHALFPDSTKGLGSTDDYSASSKVWDNKADFDARIDQLAKAATESGPKIKDAETLKVGFAAVRRVCDDCHEIYRVEKKK